MILNEHFDFDLIIGDSVTSNLNCLIGKCLVFPRDLLNFDLLLGFIVLLGNLNFNLFLFIT